MNISHRWLEEIAPGLRGSPDALADRLGMLGAPVEEMVRPGAGLDDTRYTLEITPNRPDLLSHVGVARELGPDGHHGIQLPPFPARGSDERTDAALPALDLQRLRRDGSVAGARIEVEDADGCPRYIAVAIEGVEIGPSPAWLTSRLRAIGLRPINNVVDATNYVLHELGQPLHAFDLDRLDGPAIVVRRAANGETLVTLDGEARKLDPGMLVIADAHRPVAVAGVMGGAHSEVSDGTTRVLLECACFDPKIVRRAARALALSTDASYRFERGTDTDAMERAAHRAAELIQLLAGGRVVESAVDIYPAPAEPVVVSVRPSRVEHVLGEHIEADTIEELLTHVGFELRERSEDALTLAVPGFRVHDVTREVDLIEEVARRYGYDRFDDTLRGGPPTRVPDAPLWTVEDRLRDFFVAEGLLETRSLPMVAEEAGEVPLLRPLSAEESVLRSTLTHGLLRAAELNMARGARDVRLFEIGTTFHASEEKLPDEETRAAAILMGRTRPSHWSDDAPDWDVWDIRGLAEAMGAVVGGLEVGPLEDADPGSFMPSGTLDPDTVLELGRGGELIGVAGRVAAGALDAPAWAAPVYALEVRLAPSMATAGRSRFAPLPTQPAIDRDLALLVPRGLPSAAVAGTIRESAGELLEALEVFDVYTGAGMDEGERSIAYRLVFRHPERTLKDEEVDRSVDRVLDRLKDAHGVERRG